MKLKFIKLSFAFIWANSLFAQKSDALVLDKVIAKVDNHIVLKSELDMNYLQAIAAGEKASQTSKCMVLQNIVINKMLLAKADIDSIVVEQRAVEDQLDRRMQYFTNQLGSEEQLEKYYNKSIDELKNDLRRQVKEQLLIEKVQSQLTGKIKVTPAEVRKYFNQIPKDSLPFFSKEVEVAHIVKIHAINKSQKGTSRQKLIDLKERILKGEDFSALARQFSEDPASAKQGGELGYFKRGELVPEYEAASFKLKPGEISDVVESQFGFHLIQMIERRGNEYNTKHILLKPSAAGVDMGYTSVFLDSLKTRIMQDSISFSAAATKFSDDKATAETGGLFMNQANGSSEIPMENLDFGIFTVIDTMTVGTISSPLPFRTADGKDGMRIIYFKSKKDAHVANLKDDYQKIYAATLAEKKEKQVNKWFFATKNEVFIDVDKEYNQCKITIE